MPTSNSERQIIIDTNRRALSNNLNDLSKQFYDGKNINDIVRNRASVMDNILKDIYSNYFDPYDKNIALIAVGGYGRQELLPRSDIDLLILIADQQLENYKHNIEQFFSLTWDLGTDVGSSVRTVKECAEEATKDITVITNLMEGRLLVGASHLFTKMQKTIAETRIWSKNDFFQAKIVEQKERYSKSYNSAFRLEPDIKEGPGGLRDIQTIEWVAKRYFNANSLHDLKALNFLRDDEFKSLIKGRELLWRIRFALHTLTKKNENRLLFTHQKELAKILNPQLNIKSIKSTNNKNTEAEAFMQNYFRTVTDLQRLNEMLIQVLSEAIQLENRTDVTIYNIDEHFYLRNNYIEVEDEDTFKKHPSTLLQIFLTLQKFHDSKGLGANTIRLIRNHLHLINENFRKDKINKALFISIFKQPKLVSHALEYMNRYGVLAAYLPAFANIVGRMQFDLFHIFTVDEHTLKVIQNIRRLASPDPNHTDWQPLARQIFAKLNQPEIVYLGALFHDIAKGRSGDHSELGANDALTFCLEHNLSQYDASIVAWLVKNHLLMSMTAQNKDISDNKVIQNFAEKVIDEDHLDYLYLLTIADISATNPSLLTEWKENLLRELYIRTKHALSRDLNNPIELSYKIKERKKMALDILLKNNIFENQALNAWQDFDDDYFLRHTDKEIAWQTEVITNIDKAQLPLILISKTPIRGSTAIFIYSKENSGFFAATTITLGRLNLNIVDARIITSKSGYTIDTYMVLNKNNKPIDESWQKEEIIQKLSKNLKQPDSVNTQAQRSLPRLLKEFTDQTRIYIEQNPNQNMTLVHVNALDKPGLLAHIAQALYKCNVNVHNARITNIGEQADNYFHITDKNNKPIHDKVSQNKITETLLNYIDNKNHHS